VKQLVDEGSGRPTAEVVACPITTEIEGPPREKNSRGVEKETKPTAGVSRGGEQGGGIMGKKTKTRGRAPASRFGIFPGH